VSRRPSIAADVQAQGFAVGVRTAGRVMRSLGLRAKSSRKFKCTTDSNHKYGTSPNLLNRHFTTIRPNQVW
jgi:putative transposase